MTTVESATQRDGAYAIALMDTLAHIEDLLMSIEQKLGSQASGTSSVEVKTSTRGVDTAVKAYTGSPVTEAGDAAMDEFLRVTQELTRRLMGQA